MWRCNGCGADEKTSCLEAPPSICLGKGPPCRAREVHKPLCGVICHAGAPQGWWGGLGSGGGVGLSQKLEMCVEALIHKVALTRLDLDPHSAGVSPGDHVFLVCEADERVAAYVTLPSRLPFGWGKRRTKRLGLLDPQSSRMLMPALERHANLRVRVVEIEFPHLNRNRLNTVYISVWGNPSDLIPRKHPMARIFSKSRINEPMPSPPGSQGQGSI